MTAPVDLNKRVGVKVHRGGLRRKGLEEQKREQNGRPGGPERACAIEGPPGRPAVQEIRRAREGTKLPPRWT